MHSNSEYERTIVFAEEAISHIKRNEVPAYPHSYEVWYSYLNGLNKELSAAVQQIYEKYGRVSASQIQDLHNTYLSKNPAGDKLDQMGETFSKEVDGLLQLLSLSGEQRRSFETILGQAVQDLKKPLTQEGLAKLIKRMVIETSAVERRSQALEAQLDEAKRNITSLKKHLEQVREESIMDPLTMIGNRKHFDRNLELEMANHRAANRPMSLILADIDFFKRFNDTWGHQAGDQVLRLVAMAIKGNVKTQDIPCRYGGEEFAIILPQTNLEQAALVAERIRKTVSKREVIKRSTGENLGRITISSGIATLQPDDLGPSLIHRADMCLYAAKDAGRNRVITEKDPSMRNVA